MHVREQCLLDQTETPHFSSQLIHLVPGSKDYFHVNSRRQWASRYVLARFSKVLGDASLGFLRTIVAIHHTLNPQGFGFECYVVGLFQSKPATYTYQCIDQSQSEALEIQLPTHFTAFKDLNELKDMTEWEENTEEDDMMR